jgi:RecA/RadA recombinase
LIELSDVQLERQLVGTILQDSVVLTDIIVPWESKRGKDWFTGTELRWVAASVMKSYRTFGCIPSKQLLISKLREETAKAGRKEEEREALHEQYDVLLDRLYGSTPASREICQAIVDKLVKLLRNREIAATGQKYADLINSGDAEAGLKDLKQSMLRIDALEASSSIVTGDIFDLEDEIEYIKQRREHPELFHGIPTGIKVFDDETQGIHNGETGFIIGPSGRGKTTLACEIGYNGLRAGFNVLQFTIESALQLIKFKYYSRIAQIPYNFFKFAAPQAEPDKDWVDEWLASMRGLEKKVSSKLKIVDIPEGCSPSVIEDICMHRFGSWRPDLVIIDHQGLLSPDAGQMGKGRLGWDTQGEISQSLMGKARGMRNSKGNRGVGMWVLAQGHSSLMKKKAEDISVADVGLSYLIAQPAHYIIHIIRDDIMAANDEAVLKMTKVRDGRDGLIAYVKTNFANSTFIMKEEAGGLATDVESSRITF